DASTLSVVNRVKENLPRFQSAVPSDVKVSYEFDQSPYVTRAIAGLTMEGALGALLTGLMILLFLRDWRSALVVVLNIPLALMTALLGLWISGQTINLMTLGGLALAIGILVDEATVAIENIHSHLRRGQPLAEAVRDGSAETHVPRLLAMLCILAVFVSSFFMQGAARALFVPLSLAVGFVMLSSYILSSTFVPVLSIWLLRHEHRTHGEKELPRGFERMRRRYEGTLARFVQWRGIVIAAYLVASLAIVLLIGARLGRGIFPQIEAGQFRLRMRAPDGTHIARTERLAKDALRIIGDEVGPENVRLTLGYVGMIHSNFPVNAVYQWSRGPEAAILYVEFKPNAHVEVEKLKETLRNKLAAELPDVRCSFEPADI